MHIKPWPNFEKNHDHPTKGTIKSQDMCQHFASFNQTAHHLTTKPRVPDACNSVPVVPERASACKSPTTAAGKDHHHSLKLPTFSEEGDVVSGDGCRSASFSVLGTPATEPAQMDVRGETVLRSEAAERTVLQ